MRGLAGVVAPQVHGLALAADLVQRLDRLGARRHPRHEDMRAAGGRRARGLPRLVLGAVARGGELRRVRPVAAAPFVPRGLGGVAVLVEDRIRDALGIGDELDDLGIELADAMRVVARAPVHDPLDALELAREEFPEPRGLAPSGRRAQRLPVRHLRVDVAGHRLEAQWLQPEGKGEIGRIPGRVAPREAERAADQAQQVLHPEEMAHLLARRGEQAVAPALDHRAMLLRHLFAAERVGGVEVLDHERVLDLGTRMQEHDEMVVPVRAVMRRLRPRALAARRLRGGALGRPLLQAGLARGAHVGSAPPDHWLIMCQFDRSGMGNFGGGHDVGGSRG